MVGGRVEIWRRYAGHRLNMFQRVWEMRKLRVLTNSAGTCNGKSSMLPCKGETCCASCQVAEGSLYVINCRRCFPMVSPWLSAPSCLLLLTRYAISVIQAPDKETRLKVSRFLSSNHLQLGKKTSIPEWFSSLHSFCSPNKLQLRILDISNAQNVVC